MKTVIARWKSEVGHRYIEVRTFGVGAIKLVFDKGIPIAGSLCAQGLEYQLDDKFINGLVVGVLQEVAKGLEEGA